MSSDIAISVKNISKCYLLYDRPQDRLKQSIFRHRRYYREFWALKDVSFEVKKGETVGIIGRNGSGKSTLLQIIAGTLTPTSGEVQVNGRVAALLELGSGFNPEFTGRENVYMNGAVLGLSKEEIDARFDDIAAFADIGEFIDQPVKKYSSGMVVRLAFAVQACIDPDILIVDEALAVGDEKFQRKCFARLEELKSKGTSILFVSHSTPQIVELCERAMLLEHGTRVMYAQPSSVVRTYQKLIYAPADEQERLLHEYRITDQSGNDVISVDRVESVIVPGNSSLDTFDPGLNSESTTVYPVQGAEIHSFRILDMEGRTVNLLRPGQDYQFVVTGHFLSDRDGIYFGIHIRSVSGVEITGQRFPEEGKYIERIRTGERFRITYRFKMVLLPGVYFVGGGIWSCYEPNCLHRIIDSLMFRVVPDQKSMSFGYIDASSSEPILEII
ncbi:MAG: ABC transporter ATP-binding protein [Peptococcaceae bacterium]|nr:ABC transporter ATP-binding protein [Peptococcaceae bacterium]